MDAIESRKVRCAAQAIFYGSALSLIERARQFVSTRDRDEAKCEQEPIDQLPSKFSLAGAGKSSLKTHTAKTHRQETQARNQAMKIMGFFTLWTVRAAVGQLKNPGTLNSAGFFVFGRHTSLARNRGPPLRISTNILAERAYTTTAHR